MQRYISNSIKYQERERGGGGGWKGGREGERKRKEIQIGLSAKWNLEDGP